MTRFPVRRNALVLSAVLAILALFAWASWANWKYRHQAAEQQFAGAAPGEAVPAPAGPQFAAPMIGKPAPAFALEDLGGQKLSLASLRGKAVLINFWATWCGPCRLETPWIVELRQKYSAQGFEVIGVDTEGDDLAANDRAGWAKAKAAAAKFAVEMKIPYPVLLNGDSISKAYGGLDDLPASFYVDRKGNIVAAQVGVTSQDEIESNIRKALGK
jgi:cytochrome c biogenesis protein CcmG/thiol:disulfide interchange protein DsbE